MMGEETERQVAGWLVVWALQELYLLGNPIADVAGPHGELQIFLLLGLPAILPAAFPLLGALLLHVLIATAQYNAWRVRS